MITPQLLLDIGNEIIVDNFAGGGGASTGIELALGRHVDVAINHDPVAVSMHQANHPQTEHHCESVWEVNPRDVHPGRKIGLLWLSPDCKHFSKAKGGKPVEKKIRGLAWVALRWAAIRQPRIIMLENVEEFITWGPLIEDANGKMRPCPKRKGREFNAFRNALELHGYQVEWKELRACDFGAPTIRKRLFLIARRDGQSIVWPQPTHGAPNSHAVKSGQLEPWLTTAECIDWSLPCPSIFLTKDEGRTIGVNRPLAEATMRRIAKGMMRYVINAAYPFIVPLTHHGADRRTSMNQPVPTITAAHRGEMALVQPFITEHANGSHQRNMAADEPLRTQCAQVKGGHFALVSAFMAKHYGGVVGHGLHDEPLHTVTSTDHNSLVTANLIQMGHGEQCSKGKPRWSDGTLNIEAPLNTLTASSVAAGVVTSNLVKMDDGVLDEKIQQVRAFLIKYYGNEKDGVNLREPMHTLPTKDRMGLVTVHGEDYAIADIGLRMLTPRELFRAQGFPADYIIDRGLHIDATGKQHWKPLTKTAQVRMCGNSVCPPVAAALVRANCADMIASKLPQRRTA